jgi:hypothetical protein
MGTGPRCRRWCSSSRRPWWCSQRGPGVATRFLGGFAGCRRSLRGRALGLGGSHGLARTWHLFHGPGRGRLRRSRGRRALRSERPLGFREWRWFGRCGRSRGSRSLDGGRGRGCGRTRHILRRCRRRRCRRRRLDSLGPRRLGCSLPGRRLRALWRGRGSSSRIARHCSRIGEHTSGSCGRCIRSGGGAGTLGTRRGRARGFPRRWSPRGSSGRGGDLCRCRSTDIRCRHGRSRGFCCWFAGLCGARGSV